MEPGIAGTSDRRGPRAPGERYGTVLAAPQVQRGNTKQIGQGRAETEAETT